MRQEIKAYNVHFHRHRLQAAYNESGMFVKWIVQMPRASSRGPAGLVSRVAVKSLKTSFPCLTFSIDCAGAFCRVIFLRNVCWSDALLSLSGHITTSSQSDIPLISLCAQPALQWTLACWSSEYLLLSNFITKCFLAFFLFSEPDVFTAAQLPHYNITAACGYFCRTHTTVITTNWSCQIMGDN